ncbi:hypothetical protein CEXT_209301 [Caerostris extrusa]|uniref:Ribosomal protein L5 n=1 Tax=Caerostris extrusa TaxID=172846 RepID=A0AAV4TZL9_CAEEX|nr:hypothetical protein CEXT_209301 [Caerostris extrusa]
MVCYLKAGGDHPLRTVVCHLSYGLVTFIPTVLLENPTSTSFGTLIFLTALKKKSRRRPPFENRRLSFKVDIINIFLNFPVKNLDPQSVLTKISLSHNSILSSSYGLVTFIPTILLENPTPPHLLEHYLSNGVQEGKKKKKGIHANLVCRNGKAKLSFGMELLNPEQPRGFPSAVRPVFELLIRQIPHQKSRIRKLFFFLLNVSWDFAEKELFADNCGTSLFFSSVSSRKKIHCRAKDGMGSWKKLVFSMKITSGYTGYLFRNK